jgi:UDP-N-acetylglucosamine 2-epimerase (non-hydrolysing)
MKRCYLVITDSGGVQEEAPTLGAPVVVCREKTERPEALASGTVALVGTDRDLLVNTVTALLDDPARYASMSQVSNPFGDGKASARIIQALLYHFKFTDTMPKEFVH